MARFQRQYKRIGFGFGSPAESRFIRADKNEEFRKSQRTKTFNENRIITESPTNTPEHREKNLLPVVEDRLTRMKKWQAERDKRKKIESMKKKPPFKVGVVHHKFYSPLPNNDSSTICHQNMSEQPEVPRRVTRATEKRLMAKKQALKGETRVIQKDIRPLTKKIQKKEQKSEKSFAPIHHKFKAPLGLPEIPLFGRVHLPALSPAKINSFMLSPSKTFASNVKDGTMQFLAKENKSTESVLPDFNKSDDKNLEDSSIETISLKLSMDEPNDTSLIHNEVPTKNNSIPNECTPKVQQSSNTSVCIDSPGEPVFFSPYVVTSRGKSKARKEQQIRRGFSIGRSPTDDIPTKDTVMQNLNISVKEEERTAQYFHFLLNREIDRLNGLCDKWTKIKLESDVTEDAQYLINQAVGQTKLLINKKIARFRGLVSDCESGKGEMLVTCRDLQGFWDLIHMEVENCDSRFARLEELHSRGWEEEQPVVIKPVVKKKITANKKVVSGKGSSFRAFLAQQKKQMAEKIEIAKVAGESDIRTDRILSESSVKNENSPSSRSKTRRSRSIGSNAKILTPAKRESARVSLLVKSQLSETYKKIRSPLAAMKVSKMWKTPEIQLDDTITNDTITPGKSILKGSKHSESVLKSANKVNFNDIVVTNDVPIDEETRTRLYLAKALARIDSIDFDGRWEPSTINAERKLTFDDDSADESQDGSTVNEQCTTTSQESLSHNDPTQSRKKIPRRQSAIWNNTKESGENVQDDEIPLINITVATPLQEISKDTEPHISRKVLRKQVSIEEKQELVETDTNVRILRNRTVTGATTPKSMRKNSTHISGNANELEQKENKIPSRTRRNRSTKVSINDKEISSSKIDLEDSVKLISLDENTSNRRKSTRRSVKFSDKDCTGCVEGKMPLPMTPYVRRSKVRSSETQRDSTIAEDLISWETPEKPFERVRRRRSSRQKP